MNILSKKSRQFFLTGFTLIAGNVALVNAQYSPQQKFEGVVGKRIEDTKQWWPAPTKAPKDAPNIVWILIDDVGFGASSAFGGLIQTPTFEKLANNGLRYTNFHTTALCSPTRAALLTGRNAHSVGFGHHAEMGIGTPGYNGAIPFEAGTVAEIFKENGYNTFALGKWHSTHPQDVTAAGPYNRWPTGRGFEHFYGFIGGATDQWHPQLIEENNPINIEPNTKHLNELLADKAISYIANQQSADPEKPFFLYLAPGATHAPHHVAKEWSDKYKGKFDKGWDAYREEVFNRQKALGIIPAETVLPPRQAGLKAWESLSADEKKVYARFMEVYAGFLEYTDSEVGRVIDYLKQIDALDNTAVFLMIGDNGASKEGSYAGSSGLGVAGSSGFGSGAAGEDIKFLLSQYDKIGTEGSSPNYPLGWSQAANTPFRYWKSDANSEGGSHNPLIIHYPKLIKEKGIRTQYAHVIDILPTTIELAGIEAPKLINGYPQRDFHGTSLAYSIKEEKAPTRHTVQYYELHGGRAIYKDGWKASVYHPRNTFGEKDTKDINFRTPPFEEDKWELYNLNEDWNEINNLATKYPDKLNELKALFDSEAEKYHVYPLKNYRAGVPEPIIRSKHIIHEGTTIRTRVEIGKGAVSITAAIEVPKKETEGVIFANGGLLAGTSLYIKGGKLIYLLSDGITTINLTDNKPISLGNHLVKVEYTADDQVNLLLDNQKVGSYKIEKRTKYLNSFASEGVSVGADLNAPVTKSYNGTFPFTGKVKQLVIEQ